MHVDGDLVTLLFIAALLLLTYKNTDRAAGYTPPTPQPVHTSPPNYPGIPPSLLASFAAVRDVPDAPSPFPTVAVGFSPPECMSILQYAVHRLARGNPSLELAVTGMDSAALDMDAYGTKYWTVSGMLYERSHNVAVKVRVRAMVPPDDTSIRLQSVALDSAPVPPTAGDTRDVSAASSGGYAAYELPIPSI